MSDRIFSDTGPFTIVPEWLLDTDVSDRAIRLYALLGRYADKDGEAYPSRVTLAQRLGCSLPSFKRAVKELRDLGALTVEARYDQAGDRTTNLYRLSRLTPGGVAPDPTGGGTGEPENENHVEREEGAPNGAPVRARKRDPLWDALADTVYGTLELSRALGRETGVAASDLRAQGVEPDELPAIVAAYRVRFRDAAISASAVAKWAPVLRRSGGTSQTDRRRRAEAFVRNVGFEYDRDALREELASFQLPHGDLDDLLELADGLRKQAA